jgi:predicted amidohydrolase YtcJ
MVLPAINIGGEMVFNNDSTAEGQAISREDALIAHTRRNAFFIFQENNLGSIQPGKLIRQFTLGREYSTLPADQTKDIKPVMAMVGEKIVLDADTK